MRVLILSFALAASAIPAFAGPSVQISISAPFDTSQESVYPDFEPEAVARLRMLSDRSWVEERGGGMLQTVGGKPWGLRLRVGSGPFSLDASWLKSHRWEASIDSSFHINEYRLGGNPPIYAGPFPVSQDDQQNVHRISLHTASLGVQYNCWHGFSDSIVVALGTGVQVTAVKDRMTTFHTQWMGGAYTEQIIQDIDRTHWTVNDRGSWYVSVDTEIYPMGKRKGLGIGYSLRYVPSPKTLEIAGGTLVNEYRIPIRERQVTLAAHATISF